MSQVTRVLRLPTGLEAVQDGAPACLAGAEGEKQMMKLSHAQFVAIICAANVSATFAQSPKELKTKPGTPVVLVNLLNARPDCSANPGPVTLPVVSGAPTNGIVQLPGIALLGRCRATPSYIYQIKISLDLTRSRLTL